MLSRRLLPFALAPLLASLCSVARAEPVVWVSPEIPPYLSRGANGPEGYAFELFQRIDQQLRMGAVLHVYPWARALRMLQAGQAHAALAMTRSAERESQFRWLFPVGNFRFALVTRAQDGPVKGDISALQNRRVASLRASASRSMLANAGLSQVVEGKDYADLLVLLRRGVVDVVIGPDSVMRSAAHGMGDVHLTPFEPAQSLYAGAGPAMPEETVRRIRATYQHLVDSGVVAQLKKRHRDAFFDD